MIGNLISHTVERKQQEWVSQGVQEREGRLAAPPSPAPLPVFEGLLEFSRVGRPTSKEPGSPWPHEQGGQVGPRLRQPSVAYARCAHSRASDRRLVPSQATDEAG